MIIDGTPVTFEFDDDGVVASGNTAVTIGSTPQATVSNLTTVLNESADAQLGQGDWFSVTGTTFTFNNPVNSGTTVTFARPTNNAGEVGPPVVAPAANTYTFGDAGLSPATLAAAGDRTLGINVNGRSLSQVMDQLANRVNNILQTEYGGTPKSPPSSWGERIAGENSVVFHNGSTSFDITVDMSGLTTGGVTSVVQNSLYTVEKLDSQAAWTSTSNYTVNFNGDGTPDKFMNTDEAAATDPRLQYKIDWANGAEDMNGSDSPALSVSLGNYNVADGLTQFGDTYQINFISQNGASFGNFAGVTIGEDGVVTALFDNGVTRPVFMIPVATMVNPNGMDSLSGNVWIETDFSGQPTVREAGSAGSGSVQQSSLEASTVDLGEEFTSMITTQRAYSAAAKIISTSDEMLEELLRVKR
ncbi:MAG: flagellar hook-basal body complex protein [Methylocystaceae bacterium]|nr:flagellar hook-basal body complex protein [Methylocystaceae bacterium]